MLNLNLISKKDKSAFRLMTYWRAILYFCCIAIVAVAVFIILLIPSFLFLNAQRKEILRELVIEEDAVRAFGVKEIEQRIALINERTARIRADADLERRVSDIIEKIAPLGEKLRIGEIKIDFAARTIEIRGIAPARSALLAFKHSLEESGLVENVSAPISDLIKLTDITFALKGGLK